jgi:hypothetical protein
LLAEMSGDKEILELYNVGYAGFSGGYDLSEPANGNIENYEFLPNGRGVLFEGSTASGHTLYYVDTRGTIRLPAPLHQQAEPYGGPYPAWSPDGATLGLRLKDGNDISLWIVDISKQHPAAPVRVSGAGTVTTAGWQPK